MKSRLRLSVAVTALALASGLLLPGSAGAADIVAPPPAFVPPPVISWSGLYFGGHIGAGQAEFDGCFECEDFLEDDLGTPPMFFEDLNVQGVLGGAHVGFNWDIGTFVLGIEADVSFMDWDDVIEKVRFEETAQSEEATAEVDLLASIRARLGLPVGVERRVMPYVTGGVAWADAEVTVFDNGRLDPDPDDRRTIDFDNVGGVVGGGVEYAVTDAFRVRGESLFYFFGDEEDIQTDDFDTADTVDFVELDHIWTIRVGGSWYFTSPTFGF